MKILVVEDSERLRRSLAHSLEREGHAVDLAADGAEGLDYALTYEYDVIVLDLMMPKVSGLDMLQRLRQKGNDVHVLILSAKDRVEDRVRGLKLGADDYLLKPFSYDELCARLQALVRRRYQAKNPHVEVGDFTLDTAARQVMVGGAPLHLTPSEYAILELLTLRRGLVFSKEKLLDQLYRSDSDVSSNLVEVLISSLRKKFRSVKTNCPIRTRRGHGYLIE